MADQQRRGLLPHSFDLKSGDQGKFDGIGFLVIGQSWEMSFNIGRPLRVWIGTLDFFISFVGTFFASKAIYPVIMFIAMSNLHYAVGLDPESTDAPSELVLSGDGKKAENTEDNFVKNWSQKGPRIESEQLRMMASGFLAPKERIIFGAFGRM